MSDLTIYLDKTTKTQFNDWLFVYSNNKRNKTYTFDKTRFYSLSFPVSKFDNLNQISLDAMVTEPISLVKVDEDHDIYSYNDFEQKDVIKITWLEIGERVKVVINHSSSLRFLQPVLELLGAIAQDWQGSRRDVFEYMQAQEKRYNIVIDSSHFPAEQDAAQPVNTIADNQGGTITYKYNEQGQTIITGGTVNQGYYAELGRGVAIKPYDVENSIRLNHTTGNFQPGLYPPETKDAIIKVTSETLAGLTVNADAQAEEVGSGKIENQEQEFEKILRHINFKDKTGWDIMLITLWNDGHDRTYIAGRVFKAPQRVTNRISELRRMLGDNGEKVLPKEADRKRQRVKTRYTA